MGLLRLKLNAFHCALLVAIVLLAVYAFGSFREGALSSGQRARVAIGRAVLHRRPGPTASPLPGKLDQTAPTRTFTGHTVTPSSSV